LLVLLYLFYVSKSTPAAKNCKKLSSEEWNKRKENLKYTLGDSESAQQAMLEAGYCEPTA